MAPHFTLNLNCKLTAACCCQTPLKSDIKAFILTNASWLKKSGPSSKLLVALNGNQQQRLKKK